jgi:predicted phosphoribosyltransferase
MSPAFRQAQYTDREQAGHALAGLLTHHAGPGSLVLAIPNGGVAVGVPLAEDLGSPLKVLLVRKIQIPGNTEAGFGAVALDGTTIIDERFVQQLGLTEAQVQAQRTAALGTVAERQRLYGHWAELGDLSGRTVILVDDGLASGATMDTSVEIVRQKGPARVVVAAPTASRRAHQTLSRRADELVCPHAGGPGPFAVAEAYQRWYDLDTEEVLGLLARLEQEGG